MVLIRSLWLALLLAVGVLGVGGGANAHENHQKARAEGARQAVRSVSREAAPPGVQGDMAEHMERMQAGDDGPPKSFMQRAMSWFGRMHPFAVHFPIALFPVALIALILARKRGETVELIRALIIVAGAGSVLAAGLGWVNGGLTFTDTDTVLQLHRWLGTLLALVGGTVAWWAWRRRASVNSRAMVYSLGLIVVMLLVQGFLGASVTHGMEHMMF